MDPGIALAVAAVLIVANGLFVAAEFALVATRRGLIEERAAEGDVRAGMVLRELQQLSFVLSAAQFGITATSLLVGFLAEDALGDVFVRPALETLGVPDGTATAVSVTVALMLATVLQMLFGELAPKNLAISRPEATALRLARFMRVFGIVAGPIIRVFDRAAAWTSQRVLRVEFSEELVGGHSADELSRIISASGEEGSLTEAQAELLARAVELGDTRVHEIMVPRPDVHFLSGESTIDDLRRASQRTGHSRFPVKGENEDDILGTAHIKDVLQVDPDERGDVLLADVATPALVVPESELVRRLLAQFRARQRTFAVAVDEYGGTAGIVTIEDVIEELVGEIEDEFDPRVGEVRRLGVGRFRVRGTVRADRVGELVGLELPDGDYETVAGFVIATLGEIPAEGTVIEHAGWELEVSKLDGVRVSELELRRTPRADEAEES